MHTTTTTFTTDDIAVYLLLGIATMIDASKINPYLYTIFLIVGIVLGIISIIEKFKKKKWQMTTK